MNEHPRKKRDGLRNALTLGAVFAQPSPPATFGAARKSRLTRNCATAHQHFRSSGRKNTCHARSRCHAKRVRFVRHCR